MGIEHEPPPAKSVQKIRSPERIRRGYRSFESARRGYDPFEVRNFLMQIASTIEDLEAELHRPPGATEAEPKGTDAGQAAGLPPPPGGGSDRLTKRLANFDVVTEREAQTMLAEAKGEAATIVSEAQSEAERIRSEAQGGATRSVEEACAFLEQAKLQARQTVFDLAERRRLMIEKLQQTQERLFSAAHDLELALTGAELETDVPERSASPDR